MPGFSQPDTVRSPIVKSTPVLAAGSTRPLPFKAGDALEVTAYPDSQGFPAGLYTIDGEGYVDLPIIGYLNVTGMTAHELEKLLANKYIDYMRYPLLKIRPRIRVTFNGGFFRPGLYWVDPHATLWDALHVAGGTQRMDGVKKLRWERSGKVVSNTLAVTLQEGKSLYQIGFKTGDQITVLQQPYRTRWDVFRGDVIPLVTTSLSLIISAFTLYYTAQRYR